jgi:predicted exporter
VLAPVRRTRATLVVTCVLVVLAAVMVLRLRPSASARDLVGDGHPSVAALQTVLERFPAADELLVLGTLEGGPNGADGVARLLEFARRVEAAVAAENAVRPDADRVFGRVSYGASPQMIAYFTEEVVPAGLLYLGGDEVAALRERLTPAAMAEQFRQNEAMLAAPGPAAGALARTLIRDPLRLREFLGARLAQARAGFKTWAGGPEFVSEDGTRVLVRVTGLGPPNDLAFCRRIMAEAERVIAPAAGTGVRVEFSGAYAIAAASERAIRADLTSNIIWSLVLLQLVFLVGYRNVLSFALAFAPVLVALLVGFGLFAVFTRVITPLTAAIGASLIGCGIDLSVYVISYYEEGRARGLSARDAAEEAVRELAMPLTAACTTTVVGFAAVAFSSIRALRDFAVLGSVGLLLALAGCVWVLPALLVATSRGGRAQAGARVGMGRALGVVGRTPRGWVVACGVVMVAGCVAVGVRGWPGFETDLSVMHPRPNVPLETERQISEAFASGDTLLVLVEGASGDALVARAHAVDSALRGGAIDALGAAGVFGLAQLVPDPRRDPPRFDVDRVIEDFDAAVEASAFDPAAFDGYRQFLRTLLSPEAAPTLGTLREYPEVADMVLAAGDGPPAAVTLVTLGKSSRDAAERDAAVGVLRGALEGVEGATVTGMGVVGHDVEHAVRKDLPVFFLVSLAAVVGLLLVCLRSVKYTLLSMLPLVFGGCVVVGAMSWTGERVNLANAMALPLLLGIGVDYGVFLAVLAQRSARAGETRGELLDRFTASFHAISHTAITSFVGFGTLVLTTTPAIQSLGKVVAWGVAACAAGAFLFLAPVLLLMQPQRPGRRS